MEIFALGKLIHALKQSNDVLAGFPPGLLPIIAYYVKSASNVLMTRDFKLYIPDHIEKKLHPFDLLSFRKNFSIINNETGLFVIGGCSDDSTVLNTVEYYD